MSHAALTAPCVSLRRYGAIEASDVHDFHQVVLGLDGAMVMTVDGVGQQIDSGSAWLIPAGAQHDYAGVGENRQLVLDLPAASLAVPERLFDRARAVTVEASLTQLVQRIAAHATGGIQTADDLSKRRFHWDAAARLCAAMLADAGTTQSARFDGAPGAGLDFARIDRWLRAHLSEPLRIADLATHCGFGMRRFHQLFIEAFGENAASLSAASAARYFYHAARRPAALVDRYRARSGLRRSERLHARFYAAFRARAGSMARSAPLTRLLLRL